MMKYYEWTNKIERGEINRLLIELYGSGNLENQKKRYSSSVKTFMKLYPERDEFSIFSAPGRTEIGGNHTDHQQGCVLAAAVDLDVIAIVSFHEEGIIRVKSEGYPEDIVDLSDINVNECKFGTSAELIRGIAAYFINKGVKIGGFDAYTTSNVIGGAGLSSSAAFEVLIATIINEQYNNGKADNIEIAKIGQYAENIYFGKKCGLMDQMACATGGLVFIDFGDTDNPIVEKHMYDFSKDSINICITDTKGSHANLTDDYEAVFTEMHQIASYFGKPYLRLVSETDFYNAIPLLRIRSSDRAVMRAAHFFNENNRAIEEAEALEENNIMRFLSLVRESGNSSSKFLQNLYSPQNPLQQEIPLAIMISEKMLLGNGAVRVHGGGFAGTIQAFVPNEKLNTYKLSMEKLFGENSCHIIKIRPYGGIKMFV